MTATITTVHARRVWDSRGRPTVEVEVTTDGGHRGRAIAPAGASTGSGEATDLRDGGTALGGRDVTRAIGNVHRIIAPALIGRDARDQAGIDAALDALDPTSARAELGGNATVATSLAVLHAAADSAGAPTWRYLNPQPTQLPRPEVQIIGGGAHAAGRTDVQDFMVIPMSATDIEEGLVHVAEVYHAVGDLFAARGSRLGVADEGGHWPAVDDAEQAIEMLVAGIQSAGFTPGVDIAISLDIAASEFERDGVYHLRSEDRTYTREDWLDVVARWVRTYPIVAVEDPAGEHDPAGMRLATTMIGGGALVVGDDFIVTDAERIHRAAQQGACNTALIKVNQAGTVSAAAEAHRSARDEGWATIVSARSGESEDTSVAHLAVGWSSDLVKVGSITRSERTAKWNELIRISQALGTPPLAPFPLASTRAGFA